MADNNGADLPHFWYYKNHHFAWSYIYHVFCSKSINCQRWLFFLFCFENFFQNFWCFCVCLLVYLLKTWNNVKHTCIFHLIFNYHLLFQYFLVCSLDICLVRSIFFFSYMKSGFLFVRYYLCVSKKQCVGSRSVLPMQYVIALSCRSLTLTSCIR